jgi:hypothetical protein
MRTAAGSPLRVIMTRSWVSCTRSTYADNCAFTVASGVISMTMVVVMTVGMVHVSTVAFSTIWPEA